MFLLFYQLFLLSTYGSTESQLKSSYDLLSKNYIDTDAVKQLKGQISITQDRPDGGSSISNTAYVAMYWLSVYT